METPLMAGTRRKRRRSGSWILFVLIAAVSAAVVIWWMGDRDKANSAHVTPAYMSQSGPIMIDGDWTESYALGSGEGMRIPLSVAQKLIADGIHYEDNTESIVLTTETKVLHFKTGELDATLNRKPFALRFAAEKTDGELYLPLAPLTELFGLKAEIGNANDVVTLLMPGQAVQRAEVPQVSQKGIQLREGPDKSHPIVEDLTAGSSLRIWGESEGWYKAQASSGRIGYVSKSAVSLSAIEKIPSDSPQDEPFIAWKLTGQKINLTWEAVYTANPDTNKIGELEGVNVVSPTWFELLNGKGEIRSKANAEYSAWARGRGMQVWGLFSNGFEPERTHEALSAYETRFAMIQQLLAYAKTFKLQGINIDFENVHTKDKDNLVQFVREMTPLMHEMNLVVSIDVTPKSNSEMWSVFLDRERLGQVVDFMMVMAYDEHWGSSPVAGSVSSLPWAEKSVKRILEEDGVPPEKLILGIPLYARLWTEESDGKGGTKVSSKALEMGTVQGIIKDKKLTPVLSEQTGQHYVEYKEGNTLKKIWIEDAHSIKARAELVKKYNLAGGATWRRGFETQDIWPVLDQTMQSRP